MGFWEPIFLVQDVYIFLEPCLNSLAFKALLQLGTPLPFRTSIGHKWGNCFRFLSYSVILSGGIRANGLRGLGTALKDFSMPLSMSFRLFGAMLSGVLVTELVYYYLHLSFGLPIIIGVLFTLAACFSSDICIGYVDIIFLWRGMKTKQEQKINMQARACC